MKEPRRRPPLRTKIPAAPGRVLPRADLLTAKPQRSPSEDEHIGRGSPPAAPSVVPAGPPGRPGSDRGLDVTRYSATEKSVPFLLRETDAARYRGTA